MDIRGRWISALVVAVVCAGAWAGEAQAAKKELLVPPRPVCCTDGIALRGDSLFVLQAPLDALLRFDISQGRPAPVAVASEKDPNDEELVTPDGIWIDPVTGDIYVTEILAGGVRRILPDGTRERILRGFTDGRGRPNGIVGLRRPGQPLRLFITLVSFDQEDKTGIYEIDPNGVTPPRLVYGAVANAPVFERGLQGPNAMEFDPDGRELYVPETFTGNVFAVDVDARRGRLVFDPAFEAKVPALAFANDGSILYLEQNSGRMFGLDRAGPPEQQPRLVAQLTPGVDGVDQHPDGRIFTSNFHEGGIDVVHPGGRVEELFPRSLDLPNAVAPLDGRRIAVGDLSGLAIVDPAKPRNRRLARPKKFVRDDFDIAVGAGTTGGCDVYATALFRRTLQYVDVCRPERPHTEILPRGTFVAAWDIVGRGSELWVSDAAGGVFRVTGVNGGQPARANPIGGPFENPTGIALEGDRLYVAESGSDRVRIIDPATGAPRGAIGGLDEPEGVAVEADGSVLVVEAGRGRLTRVRPDGSRRTVASGFDTDIRGVSTIAAFNYFADVAVDADGSILVSSPKEGSLTRIGCTASARPKRFRVRAGRTRVRVNVTRGGREVRRATVRLKGPGFSRSRRTGPKGNATFTVRARRAGTARASTGACADRLRVSGTRPLAPRFTG